MKRMAVACMSLLAALVLLSACNPTRLIGTWKAENFHGGPYHKLLVLAVTDEGAVRRITEQDFVDLLRQYGVNALTSSGMFPGDEKVKKEDILAKIGQYDVDGLIVTRVIKRQKETERNTDFSGDTFYDRPWGYRGYDRYYNNYYRPPLRPNYYSDWYGYYSHSREFSQARTYVTEYQIITAEANLYDAKSGHLVWTALTETTAYSDDPDALKSYAKTVAKQLAQAGLI